MICMASSHAKTAILECFGMKALSANSVTDTNSADVWSYGETNLEQDHEMKTLLLLMVQYEGLAVVPVEKVCADYFAGLTVDKFLRKTTAGEIALPVVRMFNSERAAKGVHINDLATFLDDQTDKARKELAQVRHSA